MVFSAKEKEKLHYAIYEYLAKQGFTSSCEEFLRESGLELDDNKILSPKSSLSSPSSSNSNISSSSSTSYERSTLEKKWTVVSRLQLENLKLSQEKQQLQKQLKSYKLYGEASDSSRANMVFLPSPPAIHTFPKERNHITCIRFLPGVNFIAYSTDAAIRIFDFETKEMQSSLRGHTGKVTHISVDPQGKYLASSSADLTVKIWDLATYQCIKTLRGHSHTVTCVEITSDGQKIITSSKDHTLKVWLLSTGYCQATFYDPDEVHTNRLTLNHDSTLAATCRNHDVIVRHTKSGDEVATLLKHEHVVQTAVFSPPAVNKTVRAMQSEQMNGTTRMRDRRADEAWDKYLLTAGRDKLMYLWDLSTDSVIAKFVGHDNWIHDAYFDRNGKHIISAADDKTIRIWDITTQRCIRKFEAHEQFIYTMHRHPFRTLVATGGSDKIVKIWECSPYDVEGNH